jgi:gamma-glutamyltranspeptidase
MPGGRAPAKGEIFRNPLLASTYEKIVKGAEMSFTEEVLQGILQHS